MTVHGRRGVETLLMIRNPKEQKGPQQVCVCTLELSWALPKPPLLFLTECDTDPMYLFQSCCVGLKPVLCEWPEIVVTWKWAWRLQGQTRRFLQSPSGKAVISTQVNAELGTQNRTSLLLACEPDVMQPLWSRDSPGNGRECWILLLLMACPPDPASPEDVGRLV